MGNRQVYSRVTRIAPAIEWMYGGPTPSVQVFESEDERNLCLVSTFLEEWNQTPYESGVMEKRGTRFSHQVKDSIISSMEPLERRAEKAAKFLSHWWNIEAYLFEVEMVSMTEIEAVREVEEENDKTRHVH